jgi:transposase, IS30 family
MGAVYTQLSITERRSIERWRHAKVPVDEMARVFGRSRSTIARPTRARNALVCHKLPEFRPKMRQARHESGWVAHSNRR